MKTVLICLQTYLFLVQVEGCTILLRFNETVNEKMILTPNYDIPIGNSINRK